MRSYKLMAVILATLMLASYRGWLKWCDAKGLERKYIAPVLAMGEI